MPTLTDSNINDIILSVLNKLPELEFTQAAQELTDYEVMGKWLQKDKAIITGGIGLVKDIMLRTNNSAKDVGLYEKTDINVTDLLEQIQVPWRYLQTFWAVDRHEQLFQQGGHAFVDHIQVRRTGALVDMAERLEENGWGVPSGPNDKLKPLGLPFWVVKNNSEGFNGGNPAGFSDTAGIDASVHKNWRNYTNQYVTISVTDLVKKMRTAHRKTKFRSPTNVTDFREGRGERYRIYMNEDTISDFEIVAQNQNENLGRDLAPFDDMTTFRRNPVLYVPFLDADTSDPIYMINHDTFYPMILRGDDLRESEPQKDVEQHNVWVVFVDLSYNFICADRRRNAVISK